MSAISTEYLELLRQYIEGRWSLKLSGMTCSQRLRTMIVSDAYAKFRQNENVDPAELVRRSSILVYDTMLHVSASDAMAADICRVCKLTEGKKRSYGELKNDLLAFDKVVGMFSADTFNADKLLYRSSARWLIEFGKKTGNERAVKSGMDSLRDLDNGFVQADDIAGQLANTERPITNDVGVVVEGRVNLTPEEIEENKRRFGKTIDLRNINMVPNQDGTFVPEAERIYESPYERKQAEREALKDNFDHLNDRLGYLRPEDE